MSLMLLVLGFGSVQGAFATHDGHGHSGEMPFEWAGIFETPSNTYKWGAEKTAGGYVDPGMKIVLIPATAHTEAALHAAETEGAHAFELTCENITSGGTLVPQEDHCYRLVFDQSNHRSEYTVEATGVSNVAIFAEHHPIEFERDSHYFKDTNGEDIEPLHELPEAPVPAPAPAPAEPSKPWGLTLLSSFLVNMCTLVGVIFLIPCLGNLAKTNPRFFSCCTSGFAAGALLSAAFFLLLFEATHLVFGPGDEEADVTAIWGVSVLGGFLIGSVVDTLAVAGTSMMGEKGADNTVEVGTKDAWSKDTAEKAPAAVDTAEKQASLEDTTGEPNSKIRRARILAGVLLGDFVHNICDGVFIGAAFIGCGNKFGWGVAAASIYHEIAQEISDYFVLTEPAQGNLSPLMALVLNFLSGLGVMLGAIVILAQDDVENKATGVLLAIGGGVYIQIGATECMARVHLRANSLKLRLAALSSFALGAILIGLVLVDHEHCVPEVASTDGAAPAAGGHGHGGH